MSDLKFKLNAETRHGGIILHIPLSFSGPIMVKTRHGSPSFSPRVQSRLSTFYEENHTLKGFIGDFVGSGYASSENEWDGSEIEILSRHGRIKVQFEDEQVFPDELGFFKGLRKLWNGKEPSDGPAQEQQ